MSKQAGDLKSRYVKTLLYFGVFFRTYISMNCTYSVGSTHACISLHRRQT